MNFNQDEKFEIKESLKITYYNIIIIISIMIGIVSWFTFFLLSTGDPDTWWFLLIVWSGIIIVIIFWLSLIRGFTKTRTIIITHKEIEITVPNKPRFQILWSEFDLIEIKKFKIPGPKFGMFLIVYNIFFKSKDTSRKFEYESGKDFRVRSARKILNALETWRELKTKKFLILESRK